MTMLMNFWRAPRDSTAGSRPVGADRMTSKPQNHTSAPSARSVPSIVARSPGYWRTTIGRLDVPAMAVRKSPAYLPPRTQTVSPGWTLPDAFASAVFRSHGLLMLPSPALDPEGEAKYPTCAPGCGLGVGVEVVSAVLSGGVPVIERSPAHPTSAAAAASTQKVFVSMIYSFRSGVISRPRVRK